MKSFDFFFLCHFQKLFKKFPVNFSLIYLKSFWKLFKSFHPIKIDLEYIKQCEDISENSINRND